MTRSLTLTAGLSLCWMFSPDALVLLGNSVGRGGWYFLLSLLLAVAVSSWAVYLLYPPPVKAGKKSTLHWTTQLPGLSLTIACCACLVLFIPTGTLVTAGFTFNETFVYWFPNFGFSFLLLGIVLLLHIWSEDLPRKVQVLFVGTAICCLFALSAYGLSAGMNVDDGAALQPSNAPPFSLTVQDIITLFSLTLILLLGYDQTGRQQQQPVTRSQRMLILCTGAVVVALWGTASLFHVPQAKLADSTIPYILGAREILGQPGRIIIGIAIISGSCGVLNGFLIYARNSLEQSATVFFPNLASIWKQRFIAVAVSLAIVLAMAKGLAGEEKLETYIFGALLLWLLHTGFRVFTMIRSNVHPPGQHSSYHYILPLLLLASFTFLTLTHHDSKTLSVFLALAISCSTAAAALWLLLARYGRKQGTTSPQQVKGDIS